MLPKPKTPDEIPSFDTITRALVSHIKKHWDIKAQPKGYAAFRRGYRSFQGMEEWSDSKTRATAVKNFKSFDDSTAGSHCFIDKVSLPHTAYSDLDQGRPPLETLLGACVSHGYTLGEVYAQKKAREDISSRATWGVFKLLGNLKSKEAQKAALKLHTFLTEIRHGKHGNDCTCDICNS